MLFLIVDGYMDDEEYTTTLYTRFIFNCDRLFCYKCCVCTYGIRAKTVNENTITAYSQSTQYKLYRIQYTVHYTV